MAQRNGLHSPTNGCRYFVIYAHMEKHCPTHYSEDFIDPGSNLPYGVWLKATPMGKSLGGVRLSLQPILLPHAPLNIPSASFCFGSQGKGSYSRVMENSLPVGGNGNHGVLSSTSLISTSSNEVRKRKVVTSLATRNRKNKEQTHFNDVDEITGRRSKRMLIGGTKDFIEVLVSSPTDPNELFIFEL